jgi:hypothetical protein
MSSPTIRQLAAWMRAPGWSEAKAHYLIHPLFQPDYYAWLAMRVFGNTTKSQSEIHVGTIPKLPERLAEYWRP